MTFQYCENCEKKTGHKRAIGAGTLIGAFATGGLSLVATPFYPVRCIACGKSGRGERVPWPEYHPRKYSAEEREVFNKTGKWPTSTFPYTQESPSPIYHSPMREHEERFVDDDDWKPALKFLGVLVGGLLAIAWALQGIISLLSWLFPGQ